MFTCSFYNKISDNEEGNYFQIARNLVEKKEVSKLRIGETVIRRGIREW